MFRMMFITFFGKFRGTHDQQHHLHESPKSMTTPLVILAILSVAGGLIGLPEFWHFPNWIAHHLAPVIYRPHLATLNHETEWMLMGIASAVALSTIWFAYNMFVKHQVLPANSEKEMNGVQRLIHDKFRIDELYHAIVTKPLDLISTAFDKFMESQWVDGRLS